MLTAVRRCFGAFFSAFIFLSATEAQHATYKILLPETVIPQALERSGLSAIAFSPNDKLLATASQAKDYSVKLWDLASLKVVHTLKDHANAVTGLWFSSDSKELRAAFSPLAAEGKFKPHSAVKRWNVVTGQETQQFTFAGGGANLALSRDGRLLVTVNGHPNTVAKVWIIESGKEIAALVHQSAFHHVSCAAFSPSGSLLATGGGQEGTITLWDSSRKFAFQRRFGNEGPAISGLLFSPQGSILASYSRPRLQGKSLVGGLELWDVATGQRSKFSLMTNLRFFQFSPDGNTIATSHSAGVDLWLVSSGKRIATLKAKDDGFDQFAFSHDGNRLAARNRLGDIIIWRLPRATKIDKKGNTP